MGLKDLWEPITYIAGAGILVIFCFFIKDKIKKIKNNKLPRFYRPEK